MADDFTIETPTESVEATPQGGIRRTLVFPVTLEEGGGFSVEVPADRVDPGAVRAEVRRRVAEIRQIQNPTGETGD